MLEHLTEPTMEHPKEPMMVLKSVHLMVPTMEHSKVPTKVLKLEHSMAH